MSQPLVGFSMHPLWADGDSLADFLEPLRAAGLEALEFVLDTHDPHWSRFDSLIEACSQSGFVLCFHAPYLPPYAITGFSGRRRAAIQSDYIPVLDIAARYGPATVVIHGAHSRNRPRTKLIGDTVAFLQWALARYRTLTLALENLVFDPRRVKIGADRAEMLRIMEEVDHPRLGICWDMGHDVKDDSHMGTFEKEWIAHVRHAHVHDVSWQGVDHYPLIHGRVPYRTWLPLLVEAGFSDIVSLEIKGELLTHIEFQQVKELLCESILKVARALRRERCI
jgi:sugar phosphate isomerase/epimerase